MFEKLLVAVDHSDYAAKVIDAAAELARKTGSEVRLLHVQEIAWGARAGEIPLEEREECEKQLEDAVAQLRARGVEPASALRSALTSRVAHEIADDARENDCTAIVTGAGDLSAPRALIGSTTRKLLHIAERPVVVVQ